LNVRSRLHLPSWLACRVWRLPERLGGERDEKLSNAVSVRFAAVLLLWCGSVSAAGFESRPVDVVENQRQWSAPVRLVASSGSSMASFAPDATKLHTSGESVRLAFENHRQQRWIRFSLPRRGVSAMCTEHSAVPFRGYTHRSWRIPRSRARPSKTCGSARYLVDQPVPSWNQIFEFLREVDALRRAVA
jgi:hypothetical protein